VAPAAAMKVRWMHLAEHDLEAAFDYVRQENEDAARVLVERILSAVGMLGCHPHAGREGRLKGTRELVLAGTPYLAVYRIHRDTVQILAILHAARRWPSGFDGG